MRLSLKRCQFCPVKFFDDAEPSPAAAQQSDVTLEMQPQLLSSGVPVEQRDTHQHDSAIQRLPLQCQPEGTAGAASSQCVLTGAADAQVAVSPQLAGSSQSPQDATGGSGQSMSKQSAADSAHMQHPVAVPRQQTQSVQPHAVHAQQGGPAASDSTASQRRHAAHGCGQGGTECWADVPL